VIDGGSYLPIGEFRFRAMSNLSLQLAEAIHASPDVVRSNRAFRHQTRNSLIVARNYDLFPFRDALEKFAEPRLGFECSNGGHVAQEY
jgi:hypothetical protein